MATRQVTTVFAVSGEKEYKSAIQDINREIKLLNSQLDLNVTKYTGQENSMAALEDKAKILNSLYNTQQEKVNTIRDAWNNCKNKAEEYRKKIIDTQDAIDKAKQKLEEMESAGIDKESDIYKSVYESYEKLTRTLDQEQGKLDAAVRGAQNWEIALNDAEANLIDIESQLKPISEKLDEDLTPGFNDVADAAQDVADDTEDMQERMSGAVDAAVLAVTQSGMKEAFDTIKNAINDCINESINFESSMTGVFKTVNLTAEEEKQMADSIKELATQIPQTTTEIAAIAELAGQLGIAKEDILEFTKVMLALGTSTNLSSEEAASSLAKFVNITQLSADDYERLGSAIVDLGNNFATTEADIVNMAIRMASTGEIVGMSATDILAFAATLNSLGIEAEAGGTAISKLFRKIEVAVAQNASLDYAHIAGMTSEEFNALWGSDPAKALNEFILGLGKVEKNGQNAILILQQMGLKEERLSNAIQALYTSNGLLTDALDMSAAAWEENTALSEEANRRYETSASKIQLLENAVSNLKIAIGDDFMETAGPIVDVLTDLANAGSDLVETEPGFSTALGAIGGGLGAIVGVTGAAATLKGISGAISILGPYGTTAVLVAGGIGALAGAVLTLVGSSDGLSDTTQAIIEANDKLLEKIKDSETAFNNNKQAAENDAEKVGALIDKLFAFYNQQEKTEATKEIVMQCVDELNEYLPGLGLTYDGVTEKINMTRDAMMQFAEDVTNQKMMDVLKGYWEEAETNKAELEVRKLYTEYDLQKAEKRVKETTEALKKYQEGKNSFEIAFLEISSEEYRNAIAENHAAIYEYEQLEKSLGDIESELTDIEREIARTKGAYSSYTEEVRKAAEDISGYAENTKSAGKAFVEGFAEGIEESEPVVKLAAKKIAATAEDALKTKLEIRSPSRVARRIGEFFGEGLALGIEESEIEISSVMRGITKAFDISDELSLEIKRAQAEISGIKEISSGTGRLNFDEYSEKMRSMTRSATVATARAVGENQSERIVNLTVINELDGREISREVSRIQYDDTKITARARGVR